MLHRSFCNENISLLDLRTTINPRILLPDYNRLHYPNRYMARFRYQSKSTFERLPNVSNYPEFKPMKDSGGEEMMLRAMNVFVESAKVPKEGEVMVFATRYYCDSSLFPNTWHLENYKKKGVLCLHQEGLEEGLLQLRKRKEQCTYDWKIQPVEMLVLDDGNAILQKYRSLFIREGGYLDLMTFIH